MIFCVFEYIKRPIKNASFRICQHSLMSSVIASPPSIHLMLTVNVKLLPPYHPISLSAPQSSVETPHFFAAALKLEDD